MVTYFSGKMCKMLHIFYHINLPKSLSAKFRNIYWLSIALRNLDNILYASVLFLLKTVF
jgi:hypothetical protein